MIAWELLGEASIPGGPGALRFYRRGDEFSIRVGNTELMNSRLYGTDDALGRLACEPLANHACPQVLIGGLGMGFTLATALRVLGAGAAVVQSELVAAVVEWNRGALGAVAGRPLRDSRVTVELRDVAEIINERPGRFDAILLDVDNGPEGLTRAANDALYSSAGLARAKAALRSGGAVWFWSASASPRFSARLRRSGFRVAEHRVRARGSGQTRGARNHLWEARV